MSAKELLEKVKAVFNSAPVFPAPVPPAPAAFENYPVDGGQPVYSAGHIAVGSPVFSDEAMTLPYPDGTFTVTGTSFSFTVAGGIATATTGDLNTPAAPAAAPALNVAPPAVLPAMPVTPQSTALESEIKALKEQNTKLSAALEVSNALIQKHEKIIPDLFMLCDELTKVPASDPQTLTGRKKEVFDRAQRREDKLDTIAENLKKIRQEKN